ncbi:MAG: sulfotransferase family protein [Deltaproteobacteria bacterium]|nr:sulfotransferase family protein [Deltaproteobacteria bacterium]
MFFYFDFSNYLKMIQLAWKEPNPVVRRYFLAILLLVVPVVSMFHALFFLLDAIFFPMLSRIEIREPIFIVGHARSGTTLLHRLLSRDEGRFSAFMLYELYFPSLIQKKMIRWIAGVDKRLLNDFLGRRVEAWEEKRYGAMRDVHKMGLMEYEEDDIIFYWSMASGFWITQMPYMGDVDFYYVDKRSEKKRRRLMRFYRDCVRRELYLNGADKIHLSKNPIFSGRVETLIETFPDARIIVPMRNPYETIPSLLKLMRLGWQKLEWDVPRQERCLQALADQSFHTYTHPMEVLQRHPEIRRAVVDYRKIVEDPESTISEIYDVCELPMSESYRQILRAESDPDRKHVSRHGYSLEEFGLNAQEIRNRLGDLFEKYGWGAEGDEEPPSQSD